MSINEDTVAEMLKNVINEMEGDNIDEYRQQELDILYGALNSYIDGVIKYAFVTGDSEGRPIYIMCNLATKLEGYIYVGAVVLPRVDSEKFHQFECEQIEKEKAQLKARLKELNEIQGKSV